MRVRAEGGLDAAHGVVAEVADEPAGHARQPRDVGYAVVAQACRDPVERVDVVVALDRLAVADHAELARPHLDARRARQADDRVAAPLLAAVHRLEQEAVGPVGELQVRRQRRLEVGRDGGGERYAGVALGAVALEFVRLHGNRSRGVRHGGRRRRHRGDGRSGCAVQPRQRRTARGSIVSTGAFTRASVPPRLDGRQERSRRDGGLAPLDGPILSTRSESREWQKRARRRGRPVRACTRPMFRPTSRRSPFVSDERFVVRTDPPGTSSLHVVGPPAARRRGR